MSAAALNLGENKQVWFFYNSRVFFQHSHLAYRGFSEQCKQKSSVSGIIWKAHHSKAGSVSRHQGHFPRSHSLSACPLPAQTRKALWPQSSKPLSVCPIPILPGPSLSHPVEGFQELLLPGPGCLVFPGEGSVVSRRKSKRYPWDLPHNTVASTCLLTSSLWMGPFRGPQHVPVPISS